VNRLDVVYIATDVARFVVCVLHTTGDPVQVKGTVLDEDAHWRHVLYTTERTVRAL